MKEKLNVYIPSYNRPDQCLSNVRKLLCQVRNSYNIRITIIDNCSEINYEEYFLNNDDTSKYINEDLLKVIRNNVNVGMSANIMKCFEYSSIENGWLWIISDDDFIRENAVENVFKSISEACKDVSFIKFSSNKFLHKKDFVIDSSKQLIKYISVNPRIRFNSYIFLTNMIYRIESCKKSIACSNDHNLSHFPHFILINLAISKKSYIKHDINQLADYKKPETGFSYGLFAGIHFGSIKPLIIKDISLRDFHYLFQVHNDTKVAIDLYYELASRKAIKQLPIFLFIYWLNLFFAKCYARSILFLPIMTLVTIKPFRDLLILLIMKSKFSNQINEIKKRYNLI